MKPNLFRSVSDALANRFPLIPRIRTSFITLILLCLTEILVSFFNPNGVYVPVKAEINSSFAKNGRVKYDSNYLTPGGLLNIPNPGLADRFFMADSSTDLDFLTILFIMVFSLIVIATIPKLKQETIFKKDISMAIRLTGYLVLFHALIRGYQTVVYIPERVSGITNHSFVISHGSPIIIWTEGYIALMIIAMAGMYKRGWTLQQEQDLTI